MTKVPRGDGPRKVTLMEALEGTPPSEPLDPNVPPRWFMRIERMLGTSSEWEEKRRAAWKEYREDEQRGAELRRALERTPKESDPEWLRRGHEALRALVDALPLAYAHLDRGFGGPEYLDLAKQIVMFHVPKRAGAPHKKSKADGEHVLRVIHWGNWLHRGSPFEIRAAKIAALLASVGYRLSARSENQLPNLLRAYENTKPSKVAGVRKDDALAQLVHELTGTLPTERAVKKWREKLPTNEQMDADIRTEIAAAIARREQELGSQVKSRADLGS